MFIEIKPVAIYGAIFKTKIDAKEFLLNANHSWIDGVIRFSNKTLPGLERFSPDVWVVGFEMNLGETFEKYEELWDSTFFIEDEDEEVPKPIGAMYIRVPNGFNE